MLWKCEIRNSYTGADMWTEVEIVGDNFLAELRKRFFGDVEYRNLYQFNTEESKWIKVEDNCYEER